MKLITDLGMETVSTAKHKIRFGIYECPTCSLHFKSRTANIKSGNTKSCGCLKYPKPNPLRVTSLYSSWDHMKQRCLNSKNSNYQYYGGRDITICSDWLSFDNFSKWALTNGWKAGLTIDRNNVDGNYEPTNCSWETMTVQARNTRKLQKNNTSGFRGVTIIKLTKSVKYKAEIMVNGTVERLGRFDTALEAAVAYDSYILNHGLEHTINNVVQVNTY